MKSSAVSFILALILIGTGFIVLRDKPEPFVLTSNSGIEVEGFLLGSQVPALNSVETSYFDESVELLPVGLAFENPYTVNWPADKSLFIYESSLDAWYEYQGSRPAELNELTKLAIGDTLTVEEVENLTLREDLKENAPAGTVGYTLNEVVQASGPRPSIILANKYEEGGCDGVFRASNESRRSERASELQLLVNDRLEKVNIRIIADWFIDSSAESCKLEARK